VPFNLLPRRKIILSNNSVISQMLNSTVLLRKCLLLTYNFLCYDGDTDLWGTFIFLELKIHTQLPCQPFHINNSVEECVCVCVFNISVLQVKKKKQINIDYNANVLYACNVKITCTKT